MDHGKRQRELLKAGTSLDRAVRLRSRKLDEVDDGTPTMSASSKVTYDKLLEARSTGLGNVHKTARRYPHLDAYFAGRKAATITYSVLEEYVRHRQEQGAAQETL
jgi:hypothetical protein